MFLETVLSGEEDLVKCANKAYEDVLKRYHGWIIRGIFHVRFTNSGRIGLDIMYHAAILCTSLTSLQCPCMTLIS